MLQHIFRGVAFSLILPHIATAAPLESRLQQIIHDVAAHRQTLAPRTIRPTAMLGAQAVGCTAKQTQPSRLLRYGAQILNAFTVGNAVRRGSQGRVLGNGPPLAYTGEYIAFDLLVDRLDRRASCEVQAKLNAFFALSAIYNAGQTEFPK